MSRANPKNRQIYCVKDNVIATDFPEISKALTEPDGLLAIGGDLIPSRLIDAYSRGIFPWNNDDQPVLWWSPDPRWIIFPQNIKVSKSMKKILRQKKFSVTFNHDFAAVMNACAVPRRDSEGTWITREISESFKQLHRLGYAHSVECWQDGELVGGLYGMAMGKVFFGESMFSRVSNASKVALVQLARVLTVCNFKLIDCQVHTRHLESMGAIPLSRDEFVSILRKHCQPGVRLELPRDGLYVS